MKSLELHLTEQDIKIQELLALRQLPVRNPQEEARLQDLEAWVMTLPIKIADPKERAQAERIRALVLLHATEIGDLE